MLFIVYTISLIILVSSLNINTLRNIYKSHQNIESKIIDFILTICSQFLSVLFILLVYDFLDRRYPIEHKLIMVGIQSMATCFSLTVYYSFLETL